MQRAAIPSIGANRALDLVNFFVADVQTGFGPFVAVYLTSHKWTQVEIGFALTLGTVTSLISQLPAGALVDAMYNKRAAASGALLAIIA
ncbi:MAG TPA: MFS transporter, partial [Rhodopila sp.]|nr:MFS transporter [Rhodopila sp.]